MGICSLKVSGIVRGGRMGGVLVCLCVLGGGGGRSGWMDHTFSI